MTTQPNTITGEIETIVNIFLKYTYTEAELVRGLNLIKTFLEQYYFTQVHEKSFEHALQQIQDDQNVTEIDIKLITDLYTDCRLFLTQESFYAVLDDVEKVLYSLPQLTLHLPTKLDRSSEDKIGLWVRTNISPRTILSIRINPLLVVGCGIAWNSKLTEFSFDQKAESARQSLFSLLPTL